MQRNIGYQRTVLQGNDSFEIVACEWKKGSVSPQHNHGWSHCLILIQEGCFENRAEFGLKGELSIYEPGQVIETPLGVEHEIRCVSETGKTLHVYTPKITKLYEEGNFNPRSLSEIKESLDLNLGDAPTRWTEVARQLGKIRDASIATHSPLFMNQLFSGIFPETLAAETIAAQSKTTLATFEASPAFTAIELEVVDKLCALAGWEEDHRDGIAVPGGSAANIMALHCARHRKVPEFRELGSRGEKFRVFCSQAAHYSWKKACLVTGIGTKSLSEIAIDAQGRMELKALRESLEASLASGEIPLLVCATAGTTVAGAFDPIEGIASLCEEFGVWLHVDGAWGGPALFSPKLQNQIQGMEKADSLTFDAHKLFGASITSSYFLTRHRGLLLAANDVHDGGYIFHTTEVTEDRGRLSWQCGRGPDAFSFWTLWKSLGQEGLGKFVDRQLSLRDECVEWIKDTPRLELVGSPEYLNVCVRVSPPPGKPSDPDWSRKIRERLKANSTCLVNFSRDEHGTFLRLILANPKLELSHVQHILRHALALD